MSLLRKHLVIRAHTEFRALFASSHPENMSVYNQTPGRCTKRREGWNFVVFVDLERLIGNYQREETYLFILLYKPCLIRNYIFAPKRKARIAGVWMMFELRFTVRYQKFRALAREMTETPRPGTCSGAVKWLLWLHPPGNHWRNHPGSQTLRHPETPGSHHLLVLLPELQTTHELLCCWLFKLSYSMKAAWVSVINREKKKEKNISTPASSAFPLCLHLTLLKHTQDYREELLLLSQQMYHWSQPCHLLIQDKY